MDNIEEIWLPVNEDKYREYYEISNTGRIKSLAKFIVNTGNFAGGFHKKLHYKEFFVAKDGYCITKLCRDGKCLNRKIHRLVAQAFIPNPLNLPQVNHIDGNKENNNVSNLEWCTREFNIQHAFATGLMTNNHLKGSNNPAAKINEEIVKEIRYLYDNKLMRYTDLLKKFNISADILKRVIKRKGWNGADSKEAVASKTEFGSFEPFVPAVTFTKD